MSRAPLLYLLVCAHGRVAIGVREDFFEIWPGLWSQQDRSVLKIITDVANIKLGEFS